MTQNRFSILRVGAIVSALLVVALLQLPGFAQSSQNLPSEALKVVSADKTHIFTAEIAATDRQRAQGLMHREEMALDHGMLFVFEREAEQFFWMKNTPLPLDIIFISSAGRIVSIAADTTPYSEKVIPSGVPARFVLELNAGTAAKLGIAVGDQVKSQSMGLEPS
ncbi:DUF192 domain-containing protein [Roseibium sp.]|uniref:DUF192 domain-containing protein n=1 Tax=Roseibium sp. TaxID=1936156 RepID=UPI003B51AF7D